MNCRDIQDELALLFGAELPQELEAHLESCGECREYRQQLLELDRAVPNDAEFYPSVAESEQLASEVMQCLPFESNNKAAVPWRRKLTSILSAGLRPRPLGAAVVSALLLVLGLWWISLTPEGPAERGPVLISQLSPEAVRDTSLYEPESETVALLVYEYAASEPTSPAGGIVDDLSDEEYEYLEKNLTAEDIL
jgi:hypothetical protein